MADDWQRVDKVIQWAGLSTNSFALNIGLTRAENLYRIKKGKNGVSKELAEMITRRYPDVSRAWLLTGEGSMFLCPEEGRGGIPFYESDIMNLVRQERMPTPTAILPDPRFKGCTLAALLLNDSAQPDIPCGATLFVERKPDVEHIVPGYRYVVVSDRVVGLRRISYAPGSDRLSLEAANPRYGTMVIDRCEVDALYLVRGFTVIFN